MSADDCRCRCSWCSRYNGVVVVARQSSALDEGRLASVWCLQCDTELFECRVETGLVAGEVRRDGVVQKQQLFMHHLHLNTQKQCGQRQADLYAG